MSLRWIAALASSQPFPQNISGSCLSSYKRVTCFSARPATTTGGDTPVPTPILCSACVGFCSSYLVAPQQLRLLVLGMRTFAPPDALRMVLSHVCARARCAKKMLFCFTRANVNQIRLCARCETMSRQRDSSLPQCETRNNCAAPSCHGTRASRATRARHCARECSAKCASIMKGRSRACARPTFTGVCPAPGSALPNCAYVALRPFKPHCKLCAKKKMLARSKKEFFFHKVKLTKS